MAYIEKKWQYIYNRGFHESISILILKVQVQNVSGVHTTHMTIFDLKSCETDLVCFVLQTCKACCALHQLCGWSRFVYDWLTCYKYYNKHAAFRGVYHKLQATIHGLTKLQFITFVRLSLIPPTHLHQGTATTVQITCILF